MSGIDFGTSVLNTFYIIESKMLGASLTNNNISDDIRGIHDKFIQSLIDYLNNNNKESELPQL